MRRRRLHMSRTDQKQLPGDLRTTNRQDSTDAAALVGPYGQSLYGNDVATLDDLREAVATLEDVERIARRVLGGAHPTTEGTEHDLRQARAVLRFREPQV